MHCVRQIMIEDLSDRMQQYIKAILNILYEENDWFIANYKDIAMIFAKLLRVYTFALSADLVIYKAPILRILSNIWMNRKDGNMNEKDILNNFN